MQKIKTFLWFDDQAEEAAEFYVSVMPNSRVSDVLRPTADGPAVTVSFELDGQEFVALNGGPQFKFTEAISLAVTCKDQAEVDELWTKLTADGGQPSECGWLKDKYGLSWQIVPDDLPRLLKDPDPERAQRAMQAMLTMSKIDVAALHEAADGKAEV
jgi:predicted 3-demethylubiquinone-9 3-methyltransferase (glyoxalase superfamily)